MHALDVAVADLAARQRSLVHRDQALALGMTVRQFQAPATSGLYVRMQPRVFRLAGAHPSWEQRALAACMSAGPGAAASHRCSALVWGFRGIEQAPIELTVPLDRRPRLTGVVLHRSAALHVVHRHGIPVTTPTSTLMVLGASVDARTLESAVEDAILRRLTTVARLLDLLDRLGPRGLNGTAALREVLAGRGADAAATESLAEDLLAQLLRRAGIHTFVRQYWVEGVRLDFADPVRKLGLEVDGVAFHSGAVDLQRNCRKINKLLALGWRLLHFTWADVRYRPDSVLDELAVAA